MSPAEFVNCDLWFHGPQWLREPLKDLPPTQAYETEDVQEILLKEEKRSCVVTTVQLQDDHIIYRYSSWTQLIRVTS